jgi:integrase
MERLGAGKKQGNKIPPWRFHGLRRTMATGMARLKIPLPVIEKILAHSSGTFAGIVGVYQLHSFAAEKAEALEKWGNAVEKLVSGEIEKLDADTSSNASPARKRG